MSAPTKTATDSPGKPTSRTYNLFAGQSLGRLAALSDGVCAIAMTLLVLDLHVPDSRAIVGEADLWQALVALSPRLIPYLMSFLTLGIFWVGQQTQLDLLERSDRNLTWLQLTFLLAVTIMPFSTGLLAEFTSHRLALVAYWLNILLLGAALFVSGRYAARADLIRDDAPPEMSAAMERRIVVAQALYAFGALLCAVNTYLSIAVIILVQLNYAIAPRIRPLFRL